MDGAPGRAVSQPRFCCRGVGQRRRSSREAESALTREYVYSSATRASGLPHAEARHHGSVVGQAHGPPSRSGHLALLGRQRVRVLEHLKAAAEQVIGRLRRSLGEQPEALAQPVEDLGGVQVPSEEERVVSGPFDGPLRRKQRFASGGR